MGSSMNELTGHGLVGLAARNHAQDLGARAASADEYDPKGRSMLQSNSALLVAGTGDEVGVAAALADYGHIGCSGACGRRNAGVLASVSPSTGRRRMICTAKIFRKTNARTLSTASGTAHPGLWCDESSRSGGFGFFGNWTLRG